MFLANHTGIGSGFSDLVVCEYFGHLFIIAHAKNYGGRVLDALAMINQYSVRFVI